jgi:PAS domain S-box-containing protein
MSRSLGVLHVADEPEFAKTAAESLGRADGRLDVVTETSASRALDRLRRAGGAFDCVISDYDTPGMDGLEFLDAVREEHPDLPFILFTDEGSEVVASDAIARGVTDYLPRRGGAEQYDRLADRVRDAVEQYRTGREREREVRRLKQEYQSIFEAASDSLFLVDVEGTADDPEFRIRRINPANEAALNASRDEIEGRTYAEAFSPAVVDEIVPNYERCLREGRPIRYEEELPLEGGARVFETTLAPITVGGEISRIVGVSHDITEYKERERRLSRLHEATRDLVAADTADEVAEIASETAVDILDLPMNGVHFYDEGRGGLAPATVSAATREVLGEPPVLDEGVAWQAYQRGEARVHGDVREAEDPYDSETRMRSEMALPLGEYGVFLVSSTDSDAFDDADVALAKTLAANVQSALDRVERERDLQRKTERLDEFASVVSHDLRNPLNTLELSLELAAETGDESHFERCDRAVSRMWHLIDDLLTLARMGESAADVEPIDLSELAGECWGTVDTGGATLDVGAESVVRADEARLRQLFENLFRNSVEHGADGSGVTIAVGDLDDGSGFYVADDGPGIPPGERDEIFERGYSTADRGTGFGLAIVEAIADAHGWTVEATESERGGARFEVSSVETA